MDILSIEHNKCQSDNILAMVNVETVKCIIINEK